MHTRRLIQGLALTVVIGVLATGVLVTYRLTTSLVLEELSPENWLWAPSQQNRALLVLRATLGQIAAGGEGDDDEYVVQRDVALTQVNNMVQVLERNPEAFASEQPIVTAIRTLFDTYLATETTPDAAPTPEKARELLPILDEMVGLSVDVLNERRRLASESYVESRTTIEQLQYVQFATLATLMVAGMALIWLIHKTLSDQLRFTRTQAEATENATRKMELVYRGSLVLSSQLDQDESADDGDAGVSGQLYQHYSV
ncbi:MAG: hypothetical protein HC914_15175 [Chloroflexaceae bacterium]|nr:hypothetical protein [Chloroflexaceae bacterium]